jgi:hypothetical protein
MANREIEGLVDVEGHRLDSGHTHVPSPTYLQSTGFVLDPDGRVLVSVYSSGAIGRLVPDDVIGLVRYQRTHRDT